MNTILENYLVSNIKQFEYYKLLGEKAMQQIDDRALFIKPNEESNSIAIVVQHLWGNMLSRWTDFLITDGEKIWRDRDAEFEVQLINREELLLNWNEGWACLFNALNQLTVDDLEKEVFIRNEKHTVIDAITRQLAHYAYHVGQIVYLGKMFAEKNWTTLTIPKRNSKA